MKIGILGAGSIGLLFASYLQNNHQVILYCRTNEHAKAINEEGVFLQKNHDYKTRSILAKTAANIDNDLNLLIIAVKQYHLPELSQILHSLSKQLPLLFLQNGMGHLSLLQKLPHERIFVGTVEHGALKIDQNKVKHTGLGVTRIAVFKGEKNSLEKLRKELECPDFPLIAEENWEEMLLRKLIVNVAINPLTAILKVPNGKLITNRYYRKLMESLFLEVCAIFSIKNKEASWQHVLTICEKTKANTSSMLKDIQEGRKTEIDALVGFCLEKAKEKKVECPLLQSLYLMIKGMEEDKVE